MKQHTRSYVAAFRRQGSAAAARAAQRRSAGQGAASAASTSPVRQYSGLPGNHQGSCGPKGLGNTFSRYLRGRAGDFSTAAKAHKHPAHT